jgi:integrase
MLRLYVLPHRDVKTRRALGELPLDAIGGRTVQAMIDALAVSRGNPIARHAANAVAACLRYGYDRGLIDELPARVKLPPPSPPRNRALTVEQFDRLRAAAYADDAKRKRSLLGPLVELLGDTGCRISEALGLDWGRDGLDLAADPPVAQIGRASTKTDAGVRTIPLGTAAIAALREHLLATGRPEWGTPCSATSTGAGYTAMALHAPASLASSRQPASRG